MELKNDHNVYILGAGFSHDAGLPLIKNFLLTMRDSHEWLKSKGRHREASAVERVLQFRLKAASAAYWVNMELENIEELFSLAAASDGDMDDQVRLAISATLDFSRLTNAKRYHAFVEGRASKIFVGPAHQGKPQSAPNWIKYDAAATSFPTGENNFGPFNLDVYEYHVARLLGMFANGKPVGQNSFITFNYDTILEDSLRGLGLRFCYGFKPKTVNFLEGSWGQSDESAIRVLKLHGSVNWARRQGRGRALTIYNEYAPVYMDGLIPELVPPTWKKAFENQLQAIWANAVGCLSTATRVIIIGFSMPQTDVHFKYLLAAGLQNNISLRQILFVNPTPGDLEPRIRSLLRGSYIDGKQIDVVPLTLSAFTSDQMHQLPTLGRPHEYGVATRIYQTP